MNELKEIKNKELKNKLFEKVEQELKNFKEGLKLKSPKEIIDNSYKLVCMMETKDYLLYDREYSNFELRTLLKSSNLLEECYDDWLSCDGHFREALEYSIDDTIDIMRDTEIKKERNKDVR